jgi:hypothetical protein
MSAAGSADRCEESPQERLADARRESDPHAQGEGAGVSDDDVRCKSECWDRAPPGQYTRCKLYRSHQRRHTDGCMEWSDPSTDVPTGAAQMARELEETMAGRPPVIARAAALLRAGGGTSGSACQRRAMSSSLTPSRLWPIG